MRNTMSIRVAMLATVALGLVAFVSSASAEPVGDAVGTFTYTQNMHPLGHSFFGNTPNFPGMTFTANSDLAFWGDLAFQGHYRGFRIVDISAPGNPKQISFTECFGNQGDVIVWEDILVRSWNSPATGTGSSQLVCDGEPVPAGWEGVHVFDISDLSNPRVVAMVETPNGSHTATGVPDLENNRLLVYNNSAPGGFDMVEVPLDNPAGANYLGAFATGRSCHDWAVILGDVMRAACSGGGGFSMFSLGGPSGGSLDNPQLLYSKQLPGLSGHSASFTWDGEVYIHGWEPGGGSGARCTATGTQVTPTTVQTDDMKSYFFFDPETGDELGKFVMPRDQTLEENCTIHNYNVVPTDKRYVLVSGNYQSGISVVDFSDPANAQEIAFADPAPLPHPPGTSLQLGGDWSTYWYNGFIYESDITRGLLVWNLSDRTTAESRGSIT